MRFESNWWTVELPDKYTAEPNGDCVDIVGPREIGILQLSSYRKDETVSNDDLLEFALDEVGRDDLIEVVFNEFRGFSYEYASNEAYWRRWWLSFGRTMIYATYQCVSESWEAEREYVDSIITSLQVHD